MKHGKKKEIGKERKKRKKKRKKWENMKKRRIKLKKIRKLTEKNKKKEREKKTREKKKEREKKTYVHVLCCNSRPAQFTRCVWDVGAWGPPVGAASGARGGHRSSEARWRLLSSPVWSF